MCVVLVMSATRCIGLLHHTHSIVVLVTTYDYNYIQTSHVYKYSVADKHYWMWRRVVCLCIRSTCSGARWQHACSNHQFHSGHHGNVNDLPDIQPFVESNWCRIPVGCSLSVKVAWIILESLICELVDSVVRAQWKWVFSFKRNTLFSDSCQLPLLSDNTNWERKQNITLKMMCAMW
jgi:hypothetical protein